LNTTNSKFDHKNNWENYNLGVSAYQKERKGDFKGAIEDINYGYCKFKLINELPIKMKYFLGKNLHTFLKEI
jgi:hypothetical protein